jgi:hypothetical protein
MNRKWSMEDVKYMDDMITKRHVAEMNKIIIKINKTFVKRVKKNLSRGYTECKIFRSASKFQSHVFMDNSRDIVRAIVIPSGWNIEFFRKKRCRFFGLGWRYDMYIRWVPITKH